MKPRFIFICFFIFILSGSQYAISGSRGYYVQVTDLTASKNYKKLFKNYRKQYSVDSIGPCWKKRSADWIESAYLDEQPILITLTDAKDIFNNNKSTIDRISGELKSYGDDLINSGFDGAYIFFEDNNILNMLSIASKSKKIKIISILKEKSIQLRGMDKNICLLSEPFDINFQP